VCVGLGGTLVDVRATTVVGVVVRADGAGAIVASEAGARVVSRDVGTAGQVLHTRGTTGPTIGDCNKLAVSEAKKVARFFPVLSPIRLELCKGANPVSENMQFTLESFLPPPRGKLPR
jgi:hypothetical protein